MSRLIGVDRMVSATNSKQQPVARDAKSTARLMSTEQIVNTVIDRKPQNSSVPRVMSFHDDRSSNQRREGKAGQTWSPEVPFLNAHAFPDNPLRSAEDFLFR